MLHELTPVTIVPIKRWMDDDERQRKLMSLVGPRLKRVVHLNHSHNKFCLYGDGTKPPYKYSEIRDCSFAFPRWDWVVGSINFLLCH